MKVILDQNIPRKLKVWLKSIKPEWIVYHTSDLGLSRGSDKKIFDVAQKFKAVIFTFDDDFTDIRMFKLPHFGILRLNIWPTTVEEIQKALARLFLQVKDEEIESSLIIIDRLKIRIRAL